MTHFTDSFPDEKSAWKEYMRIKRSYDRNVAAHRTSLANNQRQKLDALEQAFPNITKHGNSA